MDGAFIANLAEIYGDTDWQLFDPDTGAVRFTGTLEACEAAARPDVDPDYQNYCVQCLPEYMPDDATITYVIPLGAVLGAHTIAPFGDCGGHVNLHVGYHYHDAVTDCLFGASTTLGSVDGEVVEAHGGQIGIASANC